MKKAYEFKRDRSMENAIQNTKHTNLRLGKRFWEDCGNQTPLVVTNIGYWKPRICSRRCKKSCMNTKLTRHLKTGCDEICHDITTVNKQTQTVGITDGVTGANNSVLDVYKTIASAVHFHC